MTGPGAERGIGLIEILIVLVVVVVAGGLLYGYFGSTARTVEKIQEQKPLHHAKLAADQATLASIRSVLQTYQAQHGQWPGDKAAVLALLAGPPRFQCAGNDFDYDPASGALTLAVTDPGRC
jgi:type II secretory pathway pseudopilin PulG